MGNSHSGVIGEVTGGRKRYHRQQDLAREQALQVEENARNAAAIAQAELANQKLLMLQQLDLAVNNAKDQIEQWYATSLQQAEHTNASQSAEVQSIIQQLHSEQQQDLQQVKPVVQSLSIASPITKWEKFIANYVSITNETDLIDALMYKSQAKEMTKLYDQYKVGTRIMGGLQAGCGIGQLGLAAALAETGAGAPASLLAVRGADNLVAGSKTVVTRQTTSTMLHQTIRSVGVSDTAANLVELGVDLSSYATRMLKPGILTFYDLRTAKGCARNNFRISKDFNVASTNPSASPNLTLNDNTTLAITQKGLDRIETHLDQIFLHQNLPKELQIGERAMLERLRSGNRSLQDIEFYVSSSKPRVDTSKLPNKSTSLPSSSNTNSIQLSRETQKLLGKTNKYKGEFFERPGKTPDQTSLNAAKIELQGKQIDLAIERDISFDHISKVRAAQDGLLRHLNKINSRLSHPELPMIEREALNTELSNASKLLDYTEQFVPRTTNAPQPPQFSKPKAP